MAVKKLVGVSVVFFIFFTVLSGAAWAQDKASAAQAKMWVDKAEKYIKEHGLKEAITEFNKPAGPFIKGELYVTIIDFDGKMVCFPKDKSKIGANRSSLQDPDGKYFIKDMVNLAKSKGQGWIDYKYTNPKSKQTEQKTTYVKRIPDANMFLAVGAYK